MEFVSSVEVSVVLDRNGETKMINTKDIQLSDNERKLGFILNAVSYRTALPVTKVILYSNDKFCYPMCPRCKISMDRDYMSFCDHCGQKLNWDYVDHAEIIFAPITK